MSKRVLILLGVGFLAIVAGIFLLKYELSPESEAEFKDEVPEDIEAEAAKTSKKKYDNLPINKTLTDEAAKE